MPLSQSMSVPKQSNVRTSLAEKSRVPPTTSCASSDGTYALRLLTSARTSVRMSGPSSSCWLVVTRGGSKRTTLSWSPARIMISPKLCAARDRRCHFPVSWLARLSITDQLHGHHGAPAAHVADDLELLRKTAQSGQRARQGPQHVRADPAPSPTRFGRGSRW